MSKVTKSKFIFILLAMLLSIGCNAAEFVVLQQNKSFVMDGGQIEEMTVQAGDKIHFQNDDPFFHNVFSLSDNTTFDLGSYPKGESKTVEFKTPGVVEVECAIHPQMYLEVTVE